MTREDFRKLTEKQILLLDGGTGTYLIDQGMPHGVCVEAWVNEHAEVLQNLQKGYAEAGSNLVMAPTFGANRERLNSYGKADDIERLNRENVQISRQAVDAVASGVLVAGNMSMTGMIIYPDDDESFDEAVEVYKEQASLLAQAGCDLFAIETMISLEDARAAVRGIKAVSDLPIMVTMSFEENLRTLYGDTPEDAARVLTEEGADAVGANCSAGPDAMQQVIEKMVSVTDLPVIAKPNAGKPKPGPDGKVSYDLSPEDFAQGMTRLLKAGARIVGGCCGTTPDYIRELKKLI